MGRPSEESFNPRTHEGYDIILQHKAISSATLIPVPVKGTIRKPYSSVQQSIDFNPRTHEGYDAEAIIKIIQKGL